MTANDSLARPSLTGLAGATAAFAAGLLGGALAILALAWLAAQTPVGGLTAQLLPAGGKTAWYLARSTGVVAYLLLSGSTVWGLALSTKVIREWAPPPLALALHGTLSWLAVGFAGFHAFILLFDGYYQYTVADLLIPFTGPYRPAAVGLGIVGFYGLSLVTVSFGLRKWLGQRAWRRLHYLSFGLYILVTVHGLAAGADSGSPGIRAMYIASALLVHFLTNYRLLTLAKPAVKAARVAG
ncbi:MAG TPA: hypothetical protein VNK95_17790 [Caldilineaceae bacterium]|nr:hypothetical protein [Caldilineaceae bacterium]